MPLPCRHGLVAFLCVLAFAPLPAASASSARSTRAHPTAPPRRAHAKPSRCPKRKKPTRRRRCSVKKAAPRHVTKPAARPAPAPTLAPASHAAAPASEPAVAAPVPTADLTTSDVTSSDTTQAIAPASPPAGPLRYAPPALVNPTTIELGTGYTHTRLDPARDYIVKLPSTQKVGGTWLEGGHNVVVIGGSITIPATLPSTATSAEHTALYIKNATGTVHVEGVLIDGTGSAELDGIDVSAPDATVQLENVRIVGIHGGLNSWHADVVQPWGGVRDLRIDHLTGASNYQGLELMESLGPIGSAEISDTDLTATTEPAVDHGGHMLMLSSDSTLCTIDPVSVSNVFVVPRPGRTLANSVWPADLAGTCDGLTGTLASGLPAAGSFVPAGAVGVGYVSPGYAAP